MVEAFALRFAIMKGSSMKKQVKPKKSLFDKLSIKRRVKRSHRPSFHSARATQTLILVWVLLLCPSAEAWFARSDAGESAVAMPENVSERISSA
jgi:hypothetical protein